MKNEEPEPSQVPAPQNSDENEKVINNMKNNRLLHECQILFILRHLLQRLRLPEQEHRFQ